MDPSKLWAVSTDAPVWNTDGDCLQQLERVWFNSSQDYTQYYDATAKLASGLTEAKMISLGDFGLCTQLLDARYCLADITANNHLPASTSNTSLVHLVLGLCVVDVCNASTLHHHMPTLVERLLGVHWIVPHSADVSCTPYVYTPSAGFWATLAVLVTLVVLVMLGTILDAHHRYSARMRWDLLYHVSSNVRRMIGRREGHMTWTTIDDTFASNESLAGDSSLNEAEEHSVDSGIIRPPNAQLLVQAFEYQPGPLVRVGQCFSVISNLQSLCSRPTIGSIDCLDGLRVLSLAMIVLGQTALAMYRSTIIVNPHEVLTYTKLVRWQFVVNSYCAVDTFFVISGLLVVYIGLNRRHNSKCQLVTFYVHRILRLTPAISVVLLFWLNIVPYISNGPLWFKLQQEVIENEQRYWWSTFLYVQNFYPTSLANSCMSWLWYIAVDFQLYCFSPVVLLLMYRNKSAVAILLPLVASIALTAVLIGSYNLDVNLSASLISQKLTRPSYESLVYVKPYCRLSAYIVGAWLGFRLHVNKGRQIRLSKWFVAAGWFVCLSLGVVTIYATYPSFIGHELNIAGNVIYGAVRHVVWAAAISWLIFCCVHGYAGPVGYVLSWRGWIPLGRLTFGAFVCHGVWLAVYFHSQQTSIVMSGLTLLSVYMSTMVIIYLSSLLLTLLVELPVQNIELLLRS
jgi:peptidoglycan/LPS O-acetylase OafA/YrhL